MQNSQETFDIKALLQLERICRQRLEDEPSDTTARIDLAWCLFILAIHRAGQERLQALICATFPVDLPIGPDIQRAARQILDECLQQVLTASQLVPDARDLLDVEKLQELIRLLGEGAVVIEAQKAATRRGAAIIHDIFQKPTRNGSARRSVCRRTNSSKNGSEKEN